jgi:hypothetical protein
VADSGIVRQIWRKKSIISLYFSQSTQSYQRVGALARTGLSL